MVDLCPVVKWSKIRMVIWKPDWKNPVYCPKCPVFECSAKSYDFTIWIMYTHIVRYSDGYCIQKFHFFADEDVFRTLSGSTPIQRDAICGALSRRRSSVSRHERRSSVSGHERSKIVSIVSLAEEEDLESREEISRPRKSSVISQGKQAWSKLGS